MSAMRTKAAIELFMNSQRTRRSSPNTIEAYEWALEKVSSLYPDELPDNPESMEMLIAHQHALAPQSVRSLWQRLKTFWLWLERRGYAANAMHDVSPPQQRRRLPRTLSVDEVRQLLKHARTARDYAIIMVLLDTGMRVGEMASMRKGNLTPEGVRVTGKTGDRVVPMSRKIRELAATQGDSDYFWLGLRGVLKRTGLQQIVKRCMRRAGFQPPKLGPHTLRHTFGMQYVLKGGDLFSLQTIMGHTNINATRLYVTMTVEIAAAQLEKFTPANDYFLGGLPAWEGLIASDKEKQRAEEAPSPVASRHQPQRKYIAAPSPGDPGDDHALLIGSTLLNIRLPHSDPNF